MKREKRVVFWRRFALAEGFDREANNEYSRQGHGDQEGDGDGVHELVLE